MTVLGIIGGSGIYQIDGLEDAQRISVESPFGTPSDDLLTGTLNGLKLVFLPRHGRGHKLSPTEINYRANIDAMKRMGVTDIVSLSACGSFREDLPPGMFVVVDQFVDRTHARVKSFFSNGLVAHVSMAYPVCGRLGGVLAEAAAAEGIAHRRGGTYLVIEGPQFSTLAESELYRTWGCDLIGMTNMPEAKLAREAEICYATVAMVTDFDCWHPGHDQVEVASVIKVLTENAAKARGLVERVVRLVAARRDDHPCASGCDHALDSAIITAPEARDPALAARLDTVAGRVLRPKG
jgi:5'-methylthioadenosine phosphorylase